MDEMKVLHSPKIAHLSEEKLSKLSCFFFPPVTIIKHLYD